MTLSEFVVRVVETQRSNPSWRHGQAVFNVFWGTHPGYANSLRGSTQDPFYDDTRALPAMLQAVALGVLKAQEL